MDCQLLVSTKSGRIEGFEDGGLVKYLGIPYAKPPVGELRLKRAIPNFWDGVFQAKQYGKPGVQCFHGEVMGSEDCLTLNVVRSKEGTQLPVLVYIHGGGFSDGFTADKLYHGTHFAEDGILYVSIQYRLNVWGFYDFSTYPGCEKFDTNCGLSDMILALRWIHENIAAFGGDPDRITICGESAGGSAVLTLMSAPAAKGCFRQAIVESAIANGVSTHKTARRNIDLFLKEMNWTEQELAEKLSTADPYSILAANVALSSKGQYASPGMFLPGPVIDDLLPQRPIEAIAAGSADGVRLLIGTTKHEGTMFVRPEETGFPNSWEMVEKMFAMTGNAGGFARIKDYYSSAVPQEGLLPFVAFATDYAFQMPALKVAEAQKKWAKVWNFRFDYMSDISRESGVLATHASELPAVFAEREHSFSHFVFDGERPETVDSLIEEVHGSWVRFVKTGEPAPGVWPEYKDISSPLRLFDRESSTGRIDRTSMMEAWGDMRFYED